jgi:hypothetical protein
MDPFFGSKINSRQFRVLLYSFSVLITYHFICVKFFSGLKTNYTGLINLFSWPNYEYEELLHFLFESCKIF